MCGIAGEISNQKIKKSQIKKLVSALAHRGPDGSGFYMSEHVNIGMRRLSIIDVAGGDQPLYTEDKSIVIVGNGEIYNFIELGNKLRNLGHRFRTKSDVEIAAHAYEEWGTSFVHKLRGMYALAIYDIKKNKFIIVRDRMGEKPLYYTKVAGKLVFSSELKSILAYDSVNKEIDYNSVDLFFHYYFIPEPKTPFRNIHKLSSGSLMEVNLHNLEVEIKNYWNVSGIMPQDSGDPTEKIVKYFNEACKLTLRSDVPVGISLSGGIDSGSILAYSAPKYRDIMKGFTVGYEGMPPSDERENARKLAKKYGIDLFEIEIKSKDAVSEFTRTVWHSDDPIADIAAYSIYSVSKIAKKEGIKVLLGGMGGDEIFWGYPATIETMRNSKIKYNHPNPEKTGTYITKLYGKAMKNIEKEAFLEPIFLTKPTNKLEKARHTLAQLNNLLLRSYGLALNDRLSMANSVELRSPFLDYKLVETAFKSRMNLLSYDKGSKYYFKRAMKNTLPGAVLNRPKQGFTPPVQQWIVGIIENYSRLLTNGFLVNEGIVSPFKARFIHLYKNPITAYGLYQLILMEIWGREFVYNEKYEDLIRTN